MSEKVENVKQFAPKNLEKLKYLIVVVKKGHGLAVNQLLLTNGAAMSTLLYAEGTKDKYVADILGGEESSKECVLALVNEKYYPNIKHLLDLRFTVSAASKGILITFDVASMAGVLAYKFSADFEGARNYGREN